MFSFPKIYSLWNTFSLSLSLCNLSVARNLVQFTSLWLMGRLAIKFNTLLTIQSFQRRTRRILSKTDVVIVCCTGLKFSSDPWCVSILAIVISDKGRNSYMLINLSLSDTKFYSLLKIYLWIGLYLHSISHFFFFLIYHVEMKFYFKNFFLASVNKWLKQIDIDKIAHSSKFLLTQGSSFYEISTTQDK